MYRKTTFFVGLAVLALQLSCGDPVGISSDIKTRTPEATEINARIIGENLRVELTLRDPVVLADDERIPVLVRTTSNDRERVMSRPRYCETSELKYVCGTVIIGVGPDGLEALPERLDEFDAILLGTFISETFARVYFPYGAIEDILATVGKWPGVRTVEPDLLGTVGIVGSELPAPRELVGIMAIKMSMANRFNLRIEVGQQDSLTVEYGGSPDAPSLSQSISVR